MKSLFSSSFLFAKTGLIIGLLFFFITNPAVAKTVHAESLQGIMNQYLDHLVKNDPKGLKTSEQVKVTENGYPIKLGQGLFQTAVEIPYKQLILDPKGVHAVVFGVVKESVLPANFMVRLKVEEGTITEIETVIARKDEASVAAPQALTAVNPVYDREEPEGRRRSEKELIAIAQSYFDGIVGDHANVPFHEACNRYENGMQTTNNPPRFKTSCQQQFAIKLFSYITQVRNQRFLFADEKKGLAFGIVVFDMPGKKENFKNFPVPFDKLPPRFYKPRSMILAELFKIVDGQIFAIEALMVNIPFGGGSGWPGNEE